MRKIAITGNIGSGKSWVCEIFRQQCGVPVYGSDEAAKRMYFLPEVRRQIVRRFGEAFYRSENELDKSAVARLVFSDPVALRDLEGLLYPALFADFERWTALQQAPYVLFESALVFEKRLEKRFDAVLTVSASEATRLRRAMLRDHCDEATVRARMAKQWPEEGKRMLADFVIVHENDDEDEALIQRVRALHACLCSL